MVPRLPPVCSTQREKESRCFASEIWRTTPVAASASGSIPFNRFRVIGPNFPRTRYSQDQTEFIMAMERYMRENRRPFPCWHEVLDVLKSLGYRKVDATG